MHAKLWAIPVLLFFLAASLSPAATGQSRSEPVRPNGTDVTETGQPDIQWFKDQLEIAPKYQERGEGIMGMTWSHFLIMVFLVLFFFGALGLSFQRNRKTRRMINSLLAEEVHDPDR